MARFEDYNTNSRGICPRCRKNPNEGAVSVRLSEFQDDNPSRYHQLTSRQISMCESCCTEVFESLKALLDADAGGGTRPARSQTNDKLSSGEVTPRRRRRTRTAETR